MFDTHASCSQHRWRSFRWQLKNRERTTSNDAGEKVSRRKWKIYSNGRLHLDLILCKIFRCAQAMSMCTFIFQTYRHLSLFPMSFHSNLVEIFGMTNRQFGEYVRGFHVRYSSYCSTTVLMLALLLLLWDCFFFFLILFQRFFFAAFLFCTTSIAFAPAHSENPRDIYTKHKSIVFCSMRFKTSKTILPIFHWHKCSDYYDSIPYWTWAEADC